MWRSKVSTGARGALLTTLREPRQTDSRVSRTANPTSTSCNRPVVICRKLPALLNTSNFFSLGTSAPFLGSISLSEGSVSPSDKGHLDGKVHCSHCYQSPHLD